MDIMQLEAEAFIFFCIAGGVSAIVVAIFQILIFKYEKLGGAGLNIFYRRKADEIDIQIKSLEKDARDAKKYLQEARQTQTELKQSIKQLNKSIFLLISKLK